MESFFSRYRNALVLIAVLLAQVIGLAVQVRRPGQSAEDKGGVLLIRYWAVEVVAQPERVLHWTGRGIRGVWSDYIDLIHVRNQNQALEKQIGQLRLEEDSLAEDARQALRLQALLGFQEKYIYKTVAAQVIGTSGTEQSHVLLIDKGSEDGIQPEMPVITPDGIVGKTRDVFPHTSQVLEISDETSGAGVILVKTRIRGVLTGNSWGQPQIVNVSPDDRIKAGEPVVTSGGDGIFPRGLAVGTVQKVVPDADGTLVNVLIKPAANLSQLEEVLIITKTGPLMPAQMQDDLSQAEQRTADILAERLPSRAEPNAPANGQNGATGATGTQAAPASDANSLPTVPPPPPPPVHADRYSPGMTPPAANLTPGQPITVVSGEAGSPAISPNAGDKGAVSTPVTKPRMKANASANTVLPSPSPKASDKGGAPAKDLLHAPAKKPQTPAQPQPQVTPQQGGW